MDSGRLDRIISICKTTSTARSDDGAPVISMTTLSSQVWAEVRPVTGREKYINNAVFYETDVEFIIRYSTIVNEQCQIKYNSEYYDIKKIINWQERNVELHLLGQLNK